MRRLAAVLAIAFAAIPDDICRRRHRALVPLRRYDGARVLAALTPEQRSKAEFKFDDD